MHTVDAGLTLELLKHVDQEQMKAWEIDNIYWGKLRNLASKIAVQHACEDAAE